MISNWYYALNTYFNKSAELVLEIHLNSEACPEILLSIEIIMNTYISRMKASRIGRKQTYSAVSEKSLEMALWRYVI